MSVLRYSKLEHYAANNLANNKPNEDVLIFGDTSSNRDMLEAALSASIVITKAKKSSISWEPKQTQIEKTKKCCCKRRLY